LLATHPNVCDANFWGRDPYFGRTNARRVSPMVQLDKATALISFYRLPIKTVLLTEAFWRQFAMLVVFGGTVTQCPRLEIMRVVEGRSGITR